MEVIGDSTDPAGAAVKGENTSPDGGYGVWGKCDTGHGVHGDSRDSKGVVGESENFHGVFGHSTNNVGVAAESENAEAMNAVSHSATHAAIIAINDKHGVGILGRSGGNVGVVGEGNTGRGVHGISNTNFGVSGISNGRAGVLGTATGSGDGVIGESVSGNGVYGKGGSRAGFFEGNVHVTGDLSVHGTISSETIDNLIRRIDVLEARLASSQPSVHVGKITITQHETVAGHVRCKFKGSGFDPNKPVTIRVVSQFQAKVGDFFDHADGFGSFESHDFIDFIKPLGREVFIAATQDKDNPLALRGQVWSNTVTLNIL